MKLKPYISGACLRHAVTVLLVVLMSGAPAAAKFARGQDTPVDRLLKNVAAYVKEKPDDPKGYYLLGRINALAFALKTDKLRVFGRGNPPLPKLDPSQSRPQGEGLEPKQIEKHLTDAIANFRKAIKLKSGEGLYHLGLAYVLDVGAKMAPQVGLPGPADPAAEPTPQQVAKWKALIAKLADENAPVREQASRDLAAAMPAAAGTLLAQADDKDAERRTRIAVILSAHWKGLAAAEYLRAHELAFTADRKIRSRPLRGLNSLVSYEAGKSYVRIARDEADDEVKQTVATVTKNVKELDGKPRGPITPIVFSLSPTGGLDELLAPNASVRFDLDGDGLAQQWPWVRPATGILVWDPAGRGRITSGRQLFGSVTFWMFFHDGFHALSSLDDDRDGRLCGSELRGLAVWFDRNTNGRSESGEVVPVERLGIRAIAAKATTNIDGCPAHPEGLVLEGGATRPIYDWVADPVGE